MRYRPFGASGAAISNLTLSFGPGCLARGREAALDLLLRRLRDGDVVLVKASRGVELDRLVDALRDELGGAGR